MLKHLVVIFTILVSYAMMRSFSSRKDVKYKEWNLIRLRKSNVLIAKKFNSPHRIVQNVKLSLGNTLVSSVGYMKTIQIKSMTFSTVYLDFKVG
jgi:hypothetical protein